MKELDWKEINNEVNKVQKSKNGKKQLKLCVFFDENIGIEPDVIMFFFSVSIM
jgi:hypothetical protein